MQVKPQDIVFLVVLLFLIYMRKPVLSAGIGLLCILFALPLFAFWVFFTAERLTWFAAVFLLLAVVQNLIIIKRQ